MAHSRRTPSLAFFAALLTALAIAGPAHAASLHIADAEATVEQGGAAPFRVALTASGALTCQAEATVGVDSVYSVNAGGESASGMPADVVFSGADGHGSSANCDVTWAGAPAPYLVDATATAAPDTPVGDYVMALGYEAKNGAETGAAGKLSSAGTVSVTVHVVPAQPVPVVEQPPVVLSEPAQEVLGVRATPPRPRYGKSELLTLVSGKVTYRMPGGKAVGLNDQIVVPNGTVVDTAKGVVKVTVERSPGGALDSADAWGGGFRMRQTGGITTFTLTGGNPTSGRSSAARTKKKRLLWVNGKGNFKTRGKRASAIVRGTFWLTEETTAGDTKVSVKRGAVLVRDLVKRRNVLLRAGQNYTARARIVVARRVPAFTGRKR